MSYLDPNNPRDINSINKSREITREILSFGVNEKEIIKIIELLSLELENTNLMREINNCLKPDGDQESKKEILI